MEVIMRTLCLGLAATFAILSSSSFAQADRWTLVGTSTSGTVWYIATEDYLRGRPDQVAAPMWVKLDHSADKQVEYRETIARYTVNCREKTFRTDSFTVYRANGRSETLPKSYSFNYAVPDTVLESAIIMLCA